jgi:guanylate kinase
MSKGLLIVVSGFSGAGKGTLMKLLTSRYPDYRLSISATTRKPRDGERDGVEYFFKTEEEFKRMIEEDELIEYEGYVGHYYGTPKKYVEEMMAEGKDVILEIDVRGGLNIKRNYPDAVLIFVSAPSIKEIERRLRGRGSESCGDIEERMRQVGREMEAMHLYDYLLINDDIEECIENMKAIVSAERQKICNNKHFIDKLENEIHGGKNDTSVLL